MEKMVISQKESINTEDEVIHDTLLSKALNFLGVLLIIAGIVTWFAILGRSEADLLDTKQLLIMCTLLVVFIGTGVWIELKSQRHRKSSTFSEYISDDYDRLQDEDEEDYEDVGDYDYLQDGEEDSFNSDFPEEHGRKGGTYYGNE